MREARGIFTEQSNLQGWIPYRITPNPKNPNKPNKIPEERGWKFSKESLSQCIARTKHNPELIRLILIDFDDVNCET